MIDDNGQVELGTRKIVLWVPDWRLAALADRVPAHVPAVTLLRGRVEASTKVARERGIKRGMRLVTVQQFCPEVLVVSHEANRNDGAFESVLQVFDEVVAGVCALRPGLAWAELGEGSRWGPDEEELMAALTESVAASTGLETYVGIANGAATATAAARRGVRILKEDTESFLGNLDVQELWEFMGEGQKNEYVELSRLLQVLGVHKVSQLWQLGRRKLVTRFGQQGKTLWQLSRGQDLYVAGGRQQGAEVKIQETIDPPAFEISQTLVPARRAAQQFVDSLVHRGYHAKTVEIILEEAGGSEHLREWGMFNTANSSQVAQRIIWQLRSWQEASSRQFAAGENKTFDERGLKGIRLQTVDLVSPLQVDPLWGGAPQSNKIEETVARLQLLCGEEGVQQVRLQGGLDPRTRTVLEPWGKKSTLNSLEGEWAGALRDSPLILLDNPVPVKLVGVTARGVRGPIPGAKRGLLETKPSQIFLPGGIPELPANRYEVEDVVAVWTIRNDWWLTVDPQYLLRTYVRLAIADSADVLLVEDGNQWRIEGIFDSPTKSQWQQP